MLLSVDATEKPLDASRLIITPATDLNPVPAPDDPELWEQNLCSDHMITCRWTVGKGWDAPELKPFGDIPISPAASCLHYATQCFEGLKTYRGFDGKLRLFRPDRNAKRLVMSSKRVSLPDFDDVELVKLIKALVKLDAPRWLPKNRPGSFLYIRPALIGSGRQIGVQIPKEATLLILLIAWPDFSATPSSSTGLRLLCSENGDARAWPGGFGHAKIGANYGPSFLSLTDCRARGYDQMLWLLGNDCQVTEAGASNFFVVVQNAETGKEELLTAPVTDKIILEGITRQSVLDLTRERLTDRLTAKEEQFTMHDLVKASEESRVLEAFVSGTAFFITPISVIHFQGTDLQIPTSRKDANATYATLIKDWLKDIMYGKESHEWGVMVEEQ